MFGHRRESSQNVRVFYAADIHGSERAFRKWVNSAKTFELDALVFGGDLTGKFVVPIVREAGGKWRSELYEPNGRIESEEELASFESQLRAAGKYPVVLDPEEKATYDAHPELVQRDLFKPVISKQTREWVGLIGDRLGGLRTQTYMMLGNDDDEEVAEDLAEAAVVLTDGAVVELPGGVQMASLGFSNPTPWKTPRELPEDEIAARLDRLMDKLSEPETAILNVHCPPRDTQLDQAALLDEEFNPRMRGGQVLVGGVGSSAVRSVIDRYQPMLSLHGHIHESAAVQKLGQTTAINPGSEYNDGILRGALLMLDPRGKRLKSWQLIHG